MCGGVGVDRSGTHMSRRGRNIEDVCLGWRRTTVWTTVGTTEVGRRVSGQWRNG